MYVCVLVRTKAPPEMCPGRLHPLLEAAEAQLNAPEVAQLPVQANANPVGHWRVQEIIRSNGNIYKRWSSPAGGKHRTLKEAIETGFVPA